MTRYTKISNLGTLAGRGTKRVIRNGPGGFGTAYGAAPLLVPGTADSANSRVARIDAISSSMGIGNTATKGEQIANNFRFNADDNKVFYHVENTSEGTGDGRYVHYDFRPKNVFLPASYSVQARRTDSGAGVPLGDLTHSGAVEATIFGKEEAFNIRSEDGDAIYNGTNDIASASGGAARVTLVDNAGTYPALDKCVEILAFMVTGGPQAPDTSASISLQFNNAGVTTTRNIYFHNANNNTGPINDPVFVNDCRICGEPGFNVSIIGGGASAANIKVTVFYRYVSAEWALANYADLSGRPAQATPISGGGSKRWWSQRNLTGVSGGVYNACIPTSMTSVGVAGGGTVDGVLGYVYGVTPATGLCGVALGVGGALTPALVTTSFVTATAPVVVCRTGMNLPFSHASPPQLYDSGAGISQANITAWGKILPFDHNRSIIPASPGNTFSGRTYAGF